MELYGKTSLNLKNVFKTWKPNHIIIKVNNFVQSMTVLSGVLFYSSSESDMLHCILVYVKKRTCFSIFDSSKFVIPSCYSVLTGQMNGTTERDN